MRTDENPAKGLTEKDPNSDVTVDSHVSYGLYVSDLRYISYSKTLEGINEIASHSITFPNRFDKFLCAVSLCIYPTGHKICKELRQSLGRRLYSCGMNNS